MHPVPSADETKYDDGDDGHRCGHDDEADENDDCPLNWHSNAMTRCRMRMAMDNRDVSTDEMNPIRTTTMKRTTMQKRMNSKRVSHHGVANDEMHPAHRWPVHDDAEMQPHDAARHSFAPRVHPTQNVAQH